MFSWAHGCPEKDDSPPVSLAIRCGHTTKCASAGGREVMCAVSGVCSILLLSLFPLKRGSPGGWAQPYQAMQRKVSPMGWQSDKTEGAWVPGTALP